MGTLGNQFRTVGQGRRRENEVEVNEEMKEAMEKIVQYCGGQIQPRYVLSRLRDQFSTAAVDSQKVDLTKLITKKRSEVMKEQLRMLIG